MCNPQFYTSNIYPNTASFLFDKYYKEELKNHIYFTISFIRTIWKFSMIDLQMRIYILLFQQYANDKRFK